VLFLGFLAAQGGHVFTLAPRAYFWAVLAGLCIPDSRIGFDLASGKRARCG